MTDSTAMDFMQMEKECINRNWDRNCATCDIVQTVDVLNAAYDLAIQALEKQIAEKPNYEGDGYYNGEPVYDTWICPCCEEKYEVDYDVYDYCPNCGQKLDWSDKE